MGESINNKYKLFHVDESRENIITTINFLLKSAGERTSAIIEKSVRDNPLRKKSKKQKMKSTTSHTKGVLEVHGKIIQHKMFELGTTYVW